MKELFKKKIENIHSNLIECYRDSQSYSPTITGTEREIFHQNLLTKILPNNYRVGSGTITDHKGNETGQIDLIIELPFSLSFPVSSGDNRLYLADTVGAAFEIKSDLNNQWNNSVNKIREIFEISRTKTKDKNEVIMLHDVQIPSFIIGFKGFKTIDAIEKKLSEIPSRYWPNGILIIESNIFYGIHGGNGSIISTGKGQCILGFISYLNEILQNYAKKTIDLNNYSDLL